MRLLISVIMLAGLSIGCSKDRTDRDPCGRAIDNAARLVREEPAARQRYGDQPITRETCRSASGSELACLGYASDWHELTGCSPTALR